MVVARRALAYSDEAISYHQETASAKNKSTSQRHADNFYVLDKPMGLSYTSFSNY
jgi:hypothetical protein